MTENTMSEWTVVEALEWALPLAVMAMETHRLERLRCGHHDIGTKRVGLYDDEVADISRARAALAKAESRP